MNLVNLNLVKNLQNVILVMVVEIVILITKHALCDLSEKRPNMNSESTYLKEWSENQFCKLNSGKKPEKCDISNEFTEHVKNV